MAEHFKVRVTKDHLVFCAGHFISYEGDKCERLHGHNYRATVEIEGDLNEDSYVFDFIALKHRTKAITDELDHHMLLPTQNPVVALEERAGSVRVRYRDREWVFPRDDCVLLPIENTTAELLARYIAHRLRDDLRRLHNYVAPVLRVEVEENIGQAATCELRGHSLVTGRFRGRREIHRESRRPDALSHRLPAYSAPVLAASTDSLASCGMPIASSVAGCTRTSASWCLETGARGDEVAEDHVFLQPHQVIDLAGQRCRGQHLGRFLEARGAEEAVRLHRRLRDSEQLG